MQQGNRNLYKPSNTAQVFKSKLPPNAGRELGRTAHLNFEDIFFSTGRMIELLISSQFNFKCAYTNNNIL